MKDGEESQTYRKARSWFKVELPFQVVKRKRSLGSCCSRCSVRSMPETGCASDYGRYTAHAVKMHVQGTAGSHSSNHYTITEDNVPHDNNVNEQVCIQTWMMI